MKKILNIALAIFGILALLSVAWTALALFIITGVHPYTPDPVYSVDKSKVIISSINYNKDDYETYLQVHIEVQDTKSGETLFQVQTNASDRMNWSVTWIDSNTLKLDSSDIGSYCWTEGDGIWRETKCP